MDDVREGQNVAQIATTAAGMVTCRSCGKGWGGLKTAHCLNCHHTFTTVSAFDKHRTGGHANDTRHCVDPELVGLVSADRAYQCWGWPREEVEVER